MATKTIYQIMQAVPLTERFVLARQFYPSLKENREVAGFSDDPMGELQISGRHHRGFVHKYPDRLLVISSDTCPVLCRFCTRKRITFNRAHKEDFNFHELSQYLENHGEIQEVIFSGGDPFMLPDKKILRFMQECVKHSHVRKLRFHSRAPTLLPERFDKELFSMLNDFQKENPQITIALVIHVNHTLELSQEAVAVIGQFKKLAIAVLSQTVLLRRINDSAEILTDLFYKLASAGVQPYYLHQLDRVAGSAHFEVPLEKGRQIVNSLQNMLPENLIPSYVMDGPEGKVKVKIC